MPPSRPKQELNGLLTSGAIDGLVYLEGPQHFLIKLIWLSVVVLGITLGSIVIYSAFTGKRIYNIYVIFLI